MPLDTFERAPPPASGSSFAYPPGRPEEEERRRRQQDLAGDEELARQLAAQLRLTSPAEAEAPEEERRLPRVGDRSPFRRPAGHVGLGASLRQRYGRREGGEWLDVPFASCLGLRCRVSCDGLGHGGCLLRRATAGGVALKSASKAVRPLDITTSCATSW